MTTTPLKTFGWAFLAFVIVAIAGLSLLPSKTAHAQIDISGDWNLEIATDNEITGPSGPFPCTAGISQAGTSLDMQIKCEGGGTGALAGDIDLETGDFSATGALFETLFHFDGVASPAGDSIEGTFESVHPGITGTFVGTRKLVPFTPTPTPTPRPTFASPVDLSGTWNLRSLSKGKVGVGMPCTAVISQSGSSLDMTIECSAGTASFAGVIAPDTGVFSMSGTFSVGSSHLEGVASAAGDSLQGTWTGESPVDHGRFWGTRKVPPTTPIGDANCDGETNSIDAALVLQYAAGLVDELPCQELADVDGDGETTSADATLILQHEAGLLLLL